jgi:hypothetical protein
VKTRQSAENTGGETVVQGVGFVSSLAGGMIGGAPQASAIKPPLLQMVQFLQVPLQPPFSGSTTPIRCAGKKKKKKKKKLKS